VLLDLLSLLISFGLELFMEVLIRCINNNEDAVSLDGFLESGPATYISMVPSQVTTPSSQ